ncbi:gastrula zinc finger protein XlCGF8.2DB-like [Puntigrus tetrazona]|uniref:gastrula zinc finger protein XlCGF8.2DB-like n=1 Tax=Puntigrus tetrazona TaxID=1606681 RepID=UPI001C8AF108|nr:gastrula zinc finger protein XlCGF8.2DB-like [Puntigrus tetrazona]
MPFNIEEYKVVKTEEAFLVDHDYTKTQSKMQFKIEDEDVKTEEVKQEDTEEQQTEIVYIIEETEGSFRVKRVTDFGQKENFNNHMRNHSEEKPFRCPHCEKGFILEKKLTAHLRVHTRNNPHTCKKCGKSCSSKAHLITHMRVHAEDKPHSCKLCGKDFTGNGQLMAHIRGHTGEKSHTCDLCGKSFMNKGSLKAHIRVHTGEKPYKCPQEELLSHCAKRFRRSGIDLFALEKEDSADLSNKNIIHIIK